MLGFSAMLNTPQPGTEHPLSAALTAFWDMLSPSEALPHDIILQLSARLQPVPPNFAKFKQQRASTQQPNSPPGTSHWMLLHPPRP